MRRLAKMLNRLIDAHWFWFVYCSADTIWSARSGHVWFVAIAAAGAGLQLAWALNGGVILHPDEGRT